MLFAHIMYNFTAILVQLVQMAVFSAQGYYTSCVKLYNIFTNIYNIYIIYISSRKLGEKQGSINKLPSVPTVPPDMGRVFLRAFFAKLFESLLYISYLCNVKRKGDARRARDRLSRFRDRLIREIISCITGPNQLYKIPYQAKRQLTTINN